MSSQFYFMNPRPRVAVEFTGSKQLSRCYEAKYYRITTSKFRLDKKQLQSLREANFLGSGQEFHLLSRLDGSEDPAGFDDVPTVEFIKGEPQPGPAINPYSGLPYDSIKEPYYVYNVERRCDSGD